MKTVYINCNNCAHCVDLRTPSPADTPTLTNARNLIAQTVTQWLMPTQEELDKAFGNQEAENVTPALFLQE